MTTKECIDCDWPDVFLIPFGDRHICYQCAELRGIENN